MLLLYFAWQVQKKKKKRNLSPHPAETQLVCSVQKIIFQSVLLIGILYYTSFCVSSIKNEISEHVCAACEVLLSLDMSLNCTYLTLELVRIYDLQSKKFSAV